MLSLELAARSHVLRKLDTNIGHQAAGLTVVGLLEACVGHKKRLHV